MGRDFNKVTQRSAYNLLRTAVSGQAPVSFKRIAKGTEGSLFGDGVRLNLGDSKFLSKKKNKRTIVSMAPEATVLIKKKAFSTLKHTNDLQWMDRTEKMLLRATKALFAYKVTQIRVYESLTKIENHFKDYQELNLNLFADLLHNAQFLSVPEPEIDTSGGFFKDAVNTVAGVVTATLADLGYDGYKQDILKIMERNAFGNDNQLTTWIIDPNDVDNYSTGPGTGVIELGSFFSFSTTTSIEADPSSASIELEDPYRILNITEEDIEIAIQEALEGTVGLFEQLITGTVISANDHQSNLVPDQRIDLNTGTNAPIIDATSVVAAGAELLGLGGLSSLLDMNYVRDRLRVFYLGKTIFNAGDGVHFYIRGNKAVQDRAGVIGEGPTTGDSFKSTYMEMDKSILEAERILFTDKKIDIDTYEKIRMYGDNSLAMQHVFGGYITFPTETWGGGKWTIKINCIDNMGWLQWSRFNIEPALQDAQGILEDPLTPYELKTDSSGRVLTGEGPQLLEENKTLLQSGLLNYDSGILNGQVANENNLLQGQYNLGGGSLANSKILQHPNGLIYRWKTGIITATQDVDVSDPLSETQVTINSTQQYGLPVTNEGILNNLDIANILSVLIVGQPYNVETFVQQAYSAHNINNQSSASSLSAVDPLSGVLDVIRRQNVNFGHFRPYRMLTMSRSTIEQTASSNAIRSEVNSKVVLLQQRRQELSRIIKGLNDGPVGGENSILVRTLQEEINSIDAGIEKQIDIVRQSGSISSTDLLTSNFNLFGQNRVLPFTGEPEFDHEITRAMMIVGAQRRIEDVRLNRDQNLFIVSDQYDEHTDIRPYLFQIRNSDYKIFRGSFVNVFDKAKAASDFMNMEFFCNPQGHLEFRPPQWNKTPLSVLERLFILREERGGGDGVVPNFLADLFQTRSESFRLEIHSLNVRIVLIALLLGKYPDSSLIPGIGFSGKKSLEFFGVVQKGVKDSETKSLELSRGQNVLGVLGNLVDTGDQLLGDGIRLSANFGDEGDVINGDTTTLLGIFDPIFQEEVGALNNVLNIASNPGAASAKEIAKLNNLNKIRDDFRKNYGLDPGSGLTSGNTGFTEEDFIFSATAAASPLQETKAVGKIDKYFKKLKDAISSRDRLVTILQRNEAKQQELEEIKSILTGEFTAKQDGNEEDRQERETQLAAALTSREAEIIAAGGTIERTSAPEETRAVDKITNGLDAATDILSRAHNAVSTLTDILSGDATKGSLFDHLIANDRRNLLGPGSGRRFIIKDHDIISCSFTERPPDFCRVDVVGNAPIVGEGLQKSFDERYFWAGATDFDLWRQYGYKPKTTNLPFASSSELQCRPFSIFELQLQRVKINQATVTVAGNEFYSPGDVVYVQSKNLLYYVREVSHSFEYGTGFTTQLALENGHPPGVYLPSPLDIIGQQLTKDPITGSILVYRNQNGDDDYKPLQPDSAIIFPPDPLITMDNVAILLDHKDNQVRLTNMLTELNTVMIGNRLVLIRGFVRNEGDEGSERVKNNIEVIKQLLQNPLQIVQSDTQGLGDDFIDGVSGVFRGLGAGTGTTKGTAPLTLPNGIQASPINPEKIVEQIVVLNKGENTSSIECINPKLISSEVTDGLAISEESFQSAFPKGGPKQRTWLDIRDDLTQVSNIIEIGILDLTKVIDTAEEAESGGFGVQVEGL